MFLNEREQDILKQMRSARIAEIQRKRSWKLSVRALAIAEVTRVTEKVLKSG